MARPGAEDAAAGVSMRGGATAAGGACDVAGAADGGGGTASADVGVTSAQSSGQRSDRNDRLQLELRATARINDPARALPVLES